MIFPAEEGIVKKHRNAEGLGWLVTGLILVGEQAGGGIVAMPNAVVQAGIYSAVAMMVVFCILSTYTGIQLGESWAMLQQRWPMYRNHHRKPYPEIAFRAIGPFFRTAVSVCVNVTMFGVVVVFVLLASKNISSFLSSVFNVNFHFCIVIIIVAVAILPVTFLRSPKDFWLAVVGAMAATAIAVVFLIAGAIVDAPTCRPVVYYPDPTAEGFFHAFGTFMFAYGGHGAFPTIVHDMRKPYHFRRSAIFSFAVLLFTYIIVSGSGYIVYGGSVQDSIIQSTQTIWMQQIANVGMTLHVILSITVLINPLNQEIEERFALPHGFCWQRVLSRSCVMLAVIFVAESIPRFGTLLDLVGSSLVTLIAMVFPGTFHLFLCARESESEVPSKSDQPISWRDVIRRTSVPILLLNGVIIVVGVIGGISATVFAFKEIVSSSFEVPCYLKWLTDKDDSTNNTEQVMTGATNCCGPGRNVSIHGDPLLFCSL